MHTRTAVTSSHCITFCLWRGDQISSELFLGIEWLILSWPVYFGVLSCYLLTSTMSLEKSSQHNKCGTFHKLCLIYSFFLHPTIHSDLWQPTQQISVALVVSKKCYQVSSNVPPLSTTCRLLSATVNKKLFAVWHPLSSNINWGQIRTDSQKNPLIDNQFAFFVNKSFFGISINYWTVREAVNFEISPCHTVPKL